MWAIYLQSVTAGRILSGDGWARTAHRTAAGTAAADGEDALWLHIPFGVAIVVFAVRVNMLARRLRSPASR